MSGNSAQETHFATVAKRFNRQYRGEAFDLPPEVEGMPIFQDWASGKLSERLSSPFWQLAQPKKQQQCLDLGCGVSFLIYPWRDWQALFYGQDISSVAVEQLNARGPQLNSKLFKGVRLASAHRLDYEDQPFDLAIATGFSCYYSLEYWQSVLAAVRTVLKPGGFFVFDVLDPEQPDAENWAILETYLGSEVFLEPLTAWQRLIQQSQAKLVKQQPGDLFHLYKVRW
ncbi:class I SAM-dependent methyltransferase [Sphaerothrix gracilis]|uniref:class I SAM-dependent methyltransferase n=1 Tax=Sphaerothrix gracilis TaxID=3151835 RepID=UPI0031FDD7F4